MTIVPPTIGAVPAPEPAAPGPQPPAAEAGSVVAELAPIIQQQIEAAMTVVRAETSQALQATVDNLQQFMEARFDQERQAFATTLTQLGENQTALHGMIQQQSGIDPEALLQHVNMMVLEGIRDFFMEAVRSWATSLVVVEDPQTPVPPPAPFAPPVPAPVEKGTVG